MTAYRRTRIVVDNRLQCTLALRVVAYWLLCLMAAGLMLCCWLVLNEPVQTSSHLFQRFSQLFAPGLLASVVLLPIVLLDILRLSHRMAGPVQRLRRAVHEAAEGQAVRPVKLRENDFWQEFAEDFNRLVARLPSDPAETEEPAPSQAVHS